MRLYDHTEVVGWGTVVRRNAADIVGTVDYWRERGILEPLLLKPGFGLLAHRPPAGDDRLLLAH